MASRLDWLPTCKLKQLKAIAHATGINSGGTKPTLILSIQDALKKARNDATSTLKTKRKKDGYNILSIDMGIRNLAYCRLSLPHTWPCNGSNNSRIIPTITHWSRVDVSKSSTTTTIPTDHDEATDSKAPPKELFNPSTYASHAHNLLTRTLLPLAPTHILIERQRFRSMGGSAVQEWTLRVNMFEAMLYATLHTLRQEGAWEGEVLSVEPSKVARFWVCGEGEGKGNTEKTKKRKMAVARELVRAGTGVRAEEGLAVGDVLRGFAGKNGGKGGKTGKFDDLADSLLQGLAWVRWEENKRAVWDKGMDLLGELMEGTESGE
ncbi:MAG: hypothetical protein LQ338_002355 [Usnochroma carphineum]|nr:MAG: hypothetical protein LQ338_002355 [Usnochroma carphineum]